MQLWVCALLQPDDEGTLALEGAVPLLSVAAVAIGTGFAGAAMFAQEAQQHAMVAPGIAYYLPLFPAPRLMPVETGPVEGRWAPR